MIVIEFKHNINVIASRLRRLQPSLLNRLMDWAEKSGDMVARKASQSPNMVRGGRRRFPNTQGPLRRQSGRLANSLRTKNQESIVQRVKSEVDGTVAYTRGSRVPYSWVHEYGSAYTATPRQRAFFAAQSRLDSNMAFRPVWSALARKASNRRPIILPARPYIRPALAENERQIVGDLRNRLDQVFAIYK